MRKFLPVSLVLALVLAVTAFAVSSVGKPGVALAWDYDVRCEGGNLVGTISYPKFTPDFTVQLQDHVPGDAQFKNTVPPTVAVIDTNFFSAGTGSFSLPMTNVRAGANSVRVTNSLTNEKSDSIPPCVAPTPTPTNTATPTSTPTNTVTPEPTATNTPEPTATNTPEPTATDTPEPTATNTPEPTATPTCEELQNCPTATATPTCEEREDCPTATPTREREDPTRTPTSTPVPPTETPVPPTETPTGGIDTPATVTPLPFVPQLPDTGSGGYLEDAEASDFAGVGIILAVALGFLGLMLLIIYRYLLS